MRPDLHSERHGLLTTSIIVVPSNSHRKKSGLHEDHWEQDGHVSGFASGQLSDRNGSKSHRKLRPELGRMESARPLWLPEQQCTRDDTLSEAPCVPLLLISSTQLQAVTFRV